MKDVKPDDPDRSVRAGVGVRMTAKTDAELALQRAKQLAALRQAARRARKKAEGAAEVRGIFAPLEDHAAIKEAAARIVKRREKAAKRAAAP
jgi:hypothetical protein